jgi:hypothetical protein
VRVSKAGDRRRPFVLNSFVAQRRGSGFVQSGFYEVALMPAFEASLCHATSQNPQDSKIRPPGFDRFKF